MRYALNLDKDKRILSATFEKFAHAEAVLVSELPNGDLFDYLYIDGEYIYEPVVVEEIVEIQTTAQDDIDAMMVDHEYRITLLELGLV